MTNLNIVNKDQFVLAIVESSLKMLESVVNRFDLEKTIFLFESAHGHIARIERKDKAFLPGQEGRASRLNKEDASFFLSLPGLRWFECYTDHIQLGFDNNDTELSLNPITHLSYIAATHLAANVERNWQQLKKEKPYLADMVKQHQLVVLSAGGAEEFNKTLQCHGRKDLQIKTNVKLSLVS
jgi:hypothetical protein|tara:strand:+ start:50558 stop:51103 length:546 start_codon:yes stop_codon:yes gene_type:complete